MYTTERYPAAVLRRAVLAAVLCGAAGCAPEGPYALPDTTLRVPDSSVLPGVVSADGTSDVAVDIGAVRPVTVTLAEVTAGDCGPGDGAALSAALARALPVGTPVVLVRSATPPQRRDTVSAFVHVRPADSPDDAVPPGPSVNEQLLAEGVARLVPTVDHAAAAAPIDAQITTAATALPAPDRAYLPLLATAETAAWQAAAGILPDCIARQRDSDDTGTLAAAVSAAPVAPPVESAGPPADTLRRTDIRIDIEIRRPVRDRPWCRWSERC
ncbi:hypothetical protein [Nocardia sp. BMG111209]|uniref:hypothetical protein n=1 Tax=Nocardia sp. BMG111209 TaxID=1160137 RepID=UPI0003A67F7A|nr:hypothetical protein [Nocardia sp. BMG111209]